MRPLGHPPGKAGARRSGASARPSSQETCPARRREATAIMGYRRLASGAENARRRHQSAISAASVLAAAAAGRAGGPAAVTGGSGERTAPVRDRRQRSPACAIAGARGPLGVGLGHHRPTAPPAAARRCPSCCPSCRAWWSPATAATDRWPRCRCAARPPTRWRSTPTASRSTAPSPAAWTWAWCLSPAPSGSRSTGARARSASAARPWAGSLSLTSEAPARSRASPPTPGADPSRPGWAAASSPGSGPGSAWARALSLFDTRADFRYRSDNRTLFDPSDDRTLRRQNNQLRQLDGPLRAALALRRAPSLGLSLSALTGRQGLPARGTDDSFAAPRAPPSGRQRQLRIARRPGPRSRLRATGYLLVGEQQLRDPLGEVAFARHRYPGPLRHAGATVLGSRPIGGLVPCSRACSTPATRASVPDERIARRPPPARTPRYRAPLGLAGTPRGRRCGSSSSPACAARPHATWSARRPARQQPRAGRTHPTPTRWRASAWCNRRPPLCAAGQPGQLRPAAHAVRALRQRRPHPGQSRLGARRAGSTPTWAPPSDRPRTRPARLLIDAALFAATARDLIHFEQMGYFAGYLNVAGSRSVGLELSLSGQRARRAHLYAQITAIDVRDRSGRSPAATAGSCRTSPACAPTSAPSCAICPRPARRRGPLRRRRAHGGRFQDPANLVSPSRRRLILGAGALELAYRPAWRAR